MFQPLGVMARANAATQVGYFLCIDKAVITRECG